MKDDYASTRHRAAAVILCLLLLFIGSGTVLADLRVTHVMESPVFSSTSDEVELVFTQQIHYSDVPYIRVHFSDCSLGQRSYMTITSSADGGEQYHDGESLANYSNYSAYFNGSEVTLELYVAPGDAGIYVKTDELLVGEWGEKASKERSQSALSLCGGDDRLPWGDSRIGRWVGTGGERGTAFIICNGALVTAGHNWTGGETGFEPHDRFLNGLIEFNVPPSLWDGTVQHPPPVDQYAIDPSNDTGAFVMNIVCDIPGYPPDEDAWAGGDWAVFSCLRNSNPPYLKPIQAQEYFYRVTQEVPAASDMIRVSGYGMDAGEYNYTQKTDMGPFVAEFSQGVNFWNQYQVDTKGGDSGAPVVRSDNGFAIGVHVDKGCAEGCGGNYGTSFNMKYLANVLEDFPGEYTKYVDQTPIVSPSTGSIFAPYQTIAAATGSVGSGWTFSIVKGTYPENIRLGDYNKRIILTAPVGTVRIGQ